MFRFQSPAFLLLLPLVFFLIPSLRKVVQSYLYLVCRSSAYNYSGAGLGVTGKLTWRQKLNRILMPILCSLAFISLVVALARPQFGTNYSESKQSGRDIILTLDLSGSMQAMDFFVGSKRISRLDALKIVTKEFIEARKGDRIGLVVFAENVFTQCPLTTDTSLLKELIDGLEIGLLGDSTSIGSALALSAKRLRDIKELSKVIVLVTDGKNNSGVVSPSEASEQVSKLGIKVHAIGIGGNEPAPFPVHTPFGMRMVNQALEYDEKTLKEIASKTGGQYFNAKDTDGLRAVYDQIDKLEERIEDSYSYTVYEEKSQFFMLGGLALWLVYIALSYTFLVTVP